jgi:hypothetical protein
MAYEERKVNFTNVDQLSSLDQAETFHINAENSCEICEENGVRAVWICIDCDQNLCDKCRNAHLKSKALVSCNVVSISMKEKKTVACFIPGKFADSFADHATE